MRRNRQGFTDPDRPVGGGALGGLQLGLGRMLVRTVNLVRPRVTLGVRVVAFDAAGRVFLVRQSYVPGWQLPGGGVSPGETARDAAHPEAREEGGLVLPEPLVLFGVYLNRALSDRDHVLLFVACGARAEKQPKGVEILDSGFHAAEALPEATTPATRARIGEVLGADVPPEVW